MPGHPRLGVRIVVDAACFARVDPARDAAFDRGSGRGSRPGVPAGVRDRLAARGDRSARPRARWVARAPRVVAPSSIFPSPFSWESPTNRARRETLTTTREASLSREHSVAAKKSRRRTNLICQPSRALVAHTRAHSALLARRSRTPRPPPRLARHAPRTFAVARAEASASSPTHSAANTPTTFAMQKPTKWKHNFSAGPSVVDPGVLAKLSAELGSFEDTGMVRARVPRALARFARRTHRDASRDARRIPPRAPLVTFRRPNRLATTPPV